MSGRAGRLILAATPIGNPADASPRLASALAAAPLIAAEDTRRLARLAAALEVTVTGRVVSFFEGNEQSRVASLIEALTAGSDVLVVTDAGMPSVSDPGYRLVVAAVAAGIDVTALPGPSAVTTAVAVSGLPSDRFTFEGFPPRRPGERASAFTALATEPRTMVFFESPRRLAATLLAMASAFGESRSAAVCRELTKTYEQVIRGSLSTLAAWAGEGEVLGEICVVVAGFDPASVPAPSPAELVADVDALVADGTSRRDAITAVAARRGVRRRDVYEAATKR